MGFKAQFISKIATMNKQRDSDDLSIDEEAFRCKHSSADGLTSDEALVLLRKFGPNALPEKQKSKVLNPVAV